MDKAISMVEAKSKLADLVGQVAYGGERFVLQRRGRPMAVLISVDEYRRLRELERGVLGHSLSRTDSAAGAIGCSSPTPASASG